MSYPIVISFPATGNHAVAHATETAARNSSYIYDENDKRGIQQQHKPTMEGARPQPSPATVGWRRLVAGSRHRVHYKLKRRRWALRHARRRERALPGQPRQARACFPRVNRRARLAGRPAFWGMARHPGRKRTEHMKPAARARPMEPASRAQGSHGSGAAAERAKRVGVRSRPAALGRGLKAAGRLSPAHQGRAFQGSTSGASPHCPGNRRARQCDLRGSEQGARAPARPGALATRHLPAVQLEGRLRAGRRR